jgi:membrane-associated protein
MTLDTVLAWIGDNPSYAQYLILGLACFEAVVGIGLFIPGAILLTVAVFLYAQQLISIEAIFMAAFIGAFIGDQSGYWIGRWIGPAFHTTPFAARYRQRIERTEALIRRYGWGAILFGRIMTAIRSIVPLITGISGYSFRKYLIFDCLAIGVWSLLLCAAVVGTNDLLAD